MPQRRTGWKCQWKQLGKGFFWTHPNILFSIEIDLNQHLIAVAFFFTFGWGFLFLLFAFLLFDVLIYQTSNWWPSERQYMLGHVWNALTSLLLLSCAAPLYCDWQYFLLTCGTVRIYFFFKFLFWRGTKKYARSQFIGNSQQVQFSTTKRPPHWNESPPPKKIINSCSCLRILLCGFMLFSLFC